MNEHSGRAALMGIRALDLSRGVAGSYATMLLAACGADVVKIEPPGGDPARVTANGRRSPLFLALNAGKRSVTIDLTRPEGATLLRELALDFEILVTDMSADETERLGISYETMSAIKPRLVHVSVTPYGLYGPDAGRAAADAELIAAAGLDGSGLDEHAMALRAGLHTFSAAVTAAFTAIVMEAGHQAEIAAIETLAATLPENARLTPRSTVAPRLHIEDPDGRHDVPAPPFALSTWTPALGRAPLVGEHSEEIFFGELGKDADAVAALRAQGVM